MASSHSNLAGSGFQDILGQVFANWTVVERTASDNRGHAQWICQCKCGERRVARGSYLKSGKRFSCPGCQPAPMSVSERKLRRVWRNMIHRCTNPEDPSYARYGGRGIVVCDRWLDSFQFFNEDMGPEAPEGLSIDRIDNDGPYDKSNCRWATRKQQQRNRRNTPRLTVGGITKTLHEWAQESLVSARVIRNRVGRGWPASLAISTPLLRLPNGGRKLRPDYTRQPVS